nr:unnamed protein product [Haemonchus contortus]
MHFAVILLVAVTAVYCQIPGWKPWMGIGPITRHCKLRDRSIKLYTEFCTSSFYDRTFFDSLEGEGALKTASMRLG